MFTRRPAATLPTFEDYSTNEALTNCIRGLGSVSIPQEILREARGVAVLTFPAARMSPDIYGAGLIMARISDQRWSAPMAISCTGQKISSTSTQPHSEVFVITSLGERIIRLLAAGSDAALTLTPEGRGEFFQLCDPNLKYLTFKFLTLSVKQVGNIAFYIKGRPADILGGAINPPPGSEPIYSAIKTVGGYIPDVPDNPTCIAVYDFDDGNPQSLPLRKGDVVEVLDCLDKDWWKGRLNGREGDVSTDLCRLQLTQH